MKFVFDLNESKSIITTGVMSGTGSINRNHFSHSGFQQQKLKQILFLEVILLQ